MTLLNLSKIFEESSSHRKDPKYQMTKELPSWGTMNDLTEEQAYSVFILMTEKGFDVNLFTTSKKRDVISLFWNIKISEERMSNPSEICIFDEHFTIKEKYSGWEAGQKYGI